MLDALPHDPIRYLLGIRHVETLRRAAGRTFSMVELVYACLTHSFLAIIKMAQSNGIVVIGSATDNGVADASDEDGDSDLRRSISFYLT